MSLDRSLKTAGNLTRHRNVLSRAERIVKLADKGKFDPQAGNPLHLPKVGNRKVAAAAKSSKKEATAGDAAAAAPAAAAAAAKPAAKPAGKGK